MHNQHLLIIKNFSFFFIFFLFFFSLTNQSIIITKSGQQINIPTPTYDLEFLKNINLTLEISNAAKIITSCSFNQSNYNNTGKLIFVAPGQGCSEIQHILVAQESGASGVIVLTDNVWLSTRMVQRSPSLNRVKLPCVYMKLEYFTKYFIGLNENNSITFIMQKTPNDLDFVKKGAIIFYQIVMFSFLLVSIVLCFKKILELQWFNLMGTIISSFCIIANLFSFIYCIDPLGYWGKLTRWDLIVVVYLSFGVTYVMFLLICVYFSIIIVRITNNKIIDYTSKILFGIILLAEIALDISTIYFSLHYTYNKFKQRDLLYWRVAISCVISLFYLVGGSYFIFKINTFFTLKSDKNQQRYSQYYRLGFCVILLGLIMIFLCIVAGLFTVSSILNNPSGLLGIIAAYILSTSLCGIIFHFMFIKHKHDKSTFTHFTDNNFSKNASQI